VRLSRDEYNRNLGTWIRLQRTLFGMSQLALAAAIGVSPSSIVAWEAGKGTMLAYSRSLLGQYFKAAAKRRSLQLNPMPQPAFVPKLPPPVRPGTLGGKHAQ
jgi:transcriptional regulator with XRE-family HTH domain